MAGGEDTWLANAIRLCAVFFGLQISFVTWGVMQESLMTTDFAPTAAGAGGRFPSSVFPVFSDRCVACVCAAAVVLRKWRRGELAAGGPAGAQYAPSSLSNVLSSWAQYDALKYVSFPVQTLFKSSKVIPVMLMGRVLHGKRHRLGEYAEAAAITAGICLFTLLNSQGGQSSQQQKSTQGYGVAVLGVYVVADAFTQQWQHRLYAAHAQLDSFQMMLGMNLWSLAMTGASLLQSGGLAESAAFLLAHPPAALNLGMLSLASAVGQMFIFYTVKRFGPVVFTIIMITRQMISMGVSCALFGHALAPASLVGAAVVFTTLFCRAHRSYRASRAGKGGAAAAAAAVLPTTKQQGGGGSRDEAGDRLLSPYSHNKVVLRTVSSDRLLHGGGQQAPQAALGQAGAAAAAVPSS